MSEKDPSSERAAYTPDSTPGDPGDQSSAAKSQKNRACPFCGQAFTSSSLGRHLDLYIKPKNPKPADGVHDVDEIRRIRGGITRRQPRTGTRAAATAVAGEAIAASNDEDTPQKPASGSWSRERGEEAQVRRSATVPADNEEEGYSTTQSPSLVDTERPTPTISRPELPAGKPARPPSALQRHNWTATGVINNLPSRRADDEDTPSSGQGRRLKEMRRDAAAHRILRPDHEMEHTWKLQEQAEVGRAAELALREILGSLEAARVKVNPTRLFEDIDFFSLSFPGLCLALLPPPPTLFSASPFAAPYTWFLDPPGRKEFEAINRVMSDQIAATRGTDSEPYADEIIFRHNAHIQGSLEAWQQLPVHEQREVWKLEAMRAFVRERQQRQEEKRELQNAQQRIRHLENEFDRLSRCQLPRDYLAHPINTVPIPADISKEVRTADWKFRGAELRYDVDSLIRKWISAARSTTRAARHAASQNSSVSHQSQYVETTPNQLKADYITTGSIFNVNGPMPREASQQPTRDYSDTLKYRTPPQPGAVVDMEDERAALSNGDAGSAPIIDSRYPPRAPSAGSRLENERPWINRSPVYEDLPLNSNHKRPLSPTTTNGRSEGPKVYKEIHDGRSTV